MNPSVFYEISNLSRHKQETDQGRVHVSTPSILAHADPSIVGRAHKSSRVSGESKRSQRQPDLTSRNYQSI